MGDNGDSRALWPSQRGLDNLQRGRQMDISQALEDITPYDPVKAPHGIITSPSAADNELVPELLEKYAQRFGRTYQLKDALGYGSVAGPEAMLKAVSQFINRKFEPVRPIKHKDILTTNGVTSLIDMVAYNICDSGEGIMLPTPTYSMYEHDLCARSGLKVIPVSVCPVEDQFRSEGCSKMIAAFSEAYDKAVESGIVVKAVLICNPNNPVGRFYSRKSLTEIARFCGKHRLHLISDEIFAMSGFESTDRNGGKLDNFTSVLSIPEDKESGVFTENIHSLYGASKDFAMGGLRLGFLITRNKQLWQTCRRIALFTWLTSFSTAFFTWFISNDKFVDEYLNTFQRRLKQAYLKTSEAMDKHGIPYLQANGGFFIFIDLSGWLQYFEGTDGPQQDGKQSREEQLCRYMIKKGVYAIMGELSMSTEPGRFRFVYTGRGNEAVIAVGRIANALKELHYSEKESGDTSTCNSELSKADKISVGKLTSRFSRALQKFNCI
ncbi:hypothetical protein BP6252_05559 [Coleophoma cylindrospora]|uniref:Aminotransferase class I/classII large domain-containing protein n=1 Tax=Coleophoma cylindrospora TaxID=1849047 RepID=A0A3D8RU58_9HELO|nr:hypothetical protein BP6252_05559 [Coleophoma cylindrospora]